MEAAAHKQACTGSSISRPVTEAVHVAEYKKQLKNIHTLKISLYAKEKINLSHKPLPSPWEQRSVSSTG